MNPIQFMQQNLHINIIIVVLVIMAGFFQAKYMCAITFFKGNAKTDAALKTLLIGSIFSAVYVWLDYAVLKTTADWKAEMFVSFTVATSFYDILIKPVMIWIGLQKKDDDPAKPQ